MKFMDPNGTDTQSVVTSNQMNGPLGFRRVEESTRRGEDTSSSDHRVTSGLPAPDVRQSRVSKDNRVMMIRLFFLPPFGQSPNPLLPPTPASASVSNFFSLRSICSEVQSWREKSLSSYQDEVCLVLRLKKEVCRLHYLLKEKENETIALKTENDFLKRLLKESTPDGQSAVFFFYL